MVSPYGQAGIEFGIPQWKSAYLQILNCAYAKLHVAETGNSNLELNHTVERDYLDILLFYQNNTREVTMS